MRSGMAANRTWKAAIVTGAASGIGRCFAETLAGEGTAVGLIDVSGDGLTAAATAVRGRGGQVETRVADVSVESAISDAVQGLVSALGSLDLLIHCAAILGPGAFAAQSSAAFERVIRVNLPCTGGRR
jgi:NAD(P)-dependent dehydrogenase (short-subunit alcohol dehydrogenase family)